MKNFNSFSPNSVSGSHNNERIQLVAGDSGFQLRVWLKSSPCNLDPTVDPADETDVANWPPMDLTKVNDIKLYFAYNNDIENVSILPCTIVNPRSNGVIIVYFQPGVIANNSGYGEGEVEITFKDGEVLTVFEKLLFDVRKDLGGNG